MLDVRRNPHRAEGRHQPGHAGGGDAQRAAQRKGELRPVVAVRRHMDVGRQAAQVDGERLGGGRRATRAGIERQGCQHCDNFCRTIAFASIGRLVKLVA
ncbi:hypothetical protein SDC9_159482 [bioreactor metagenome]|uniref:Uncharacterized protein n=1 Tax=bioreactor metagenome TaxID=1076179 RepID=A0A645FDX6_9ZZZZ